MDLMTMRIDDKQATIVDSKILNGNLLTYLASLIIRVFPDILHPVYDKPNDPKINNTMFLPEIFPHEALLSEDYITELKGSSRVSSILPKNFSKDEVEEAIIKYFSAIVQGKLLNEISRQNSQRSQEPGQFKSISRGQNQKEEDDGEDDNSQDDDDDDDADSDTNKADQTLGADDEDDEKNESEEESEKPPPKKTTKKPTKQPTAPKKSNLTKKR